MKTIERVVKRLMLDFVEQICVWGKVGGASFQRLLDSLKDRGSAVARKVLEKSLLGGGLSLSPSPF